MNYAGIKYTDIANGLGCRTVLFVSAPVISSYPECLSKS